MLYNFFAITISIVLGFLILKLIYKEKFKLNNKTIIFELLFLTLGFLTRLVLIDIIPNGLNTDEASAGYDAFSILNYGIDRHGNYLPVFLESWGSGQNVLLTYLAIPFIKIIGLNALAIRLPMAIIGCISLVIWFMLLRRISNEKFARLGLIFLAICPWHIMKSRWGLESNLFPDIILLSIFLLIKGLQDENKILYYLSFVLFSISTYAYGTSYFFLPTFIIILLTILIKKKQIKIKEAIFSLLIIGVISSPIILCIFINKFDLNQINLPFMTIPKLPIMRYENMSSIFSGNIIINSLGNFLRGVSIIVLQNDGLQWNALTISGITYKISIIFTIIGIIKAFEEKTKYGYIFNTWFLAGLLLMFVCEPNINRINIIWFPIIYYTIFGIKSVVEQKEIFKKWIIVLYILSFIVFLFEYISEDTSRYQTFNTNMKEVTEYINKINKDEQDIYISNSIKEAYIYCLFYNKYNTHKFVDTVKYKNGPLKEFQTVQSFGNYKFEKIYILQHDNIYVIEEKKLNKLVINNNEWYMKKINNYVVLNTKK